jgi:hypothetical protein
MPIEITDSFIRVRQVDPSLFQKESFRTIDIDKSHGIKAVIGRRPGSKSTEIQTFLFNKDHWTIEEAKDWVAEHKNHANASLLFTKSSVRRVETGTTAFAAALRDTLPFQKLLKGKANMASIEVRQ